MLAQFVDGRMVVTADLVRQRQIGGIEDARLSAKQLEQSRGFLDRETRIRALPQGAVEQQDSRRRLVGAKTNGRAGMDEGGVERREGVGIGEWA